MNSAKLNVDAAFSLENSSVAASAVLRNFQGNFIAASTTIISHVPSATMAEVLAMLHGLMLANSLGFNDVEAESDSLEEIQLCSGVVRIWNDAITIYADILNQAGIIEKVLFFTLRQRYKYCSS